MKTIKSLLIAAIITTISISSNAQLKPVDDDGLAIGGYDLVSYFSATAVEGDPSISTQYKGATYRFSSKKNLKAFNEEPEKYLPQFGGYCAWGVGEKGHKFTINPETYDIIDGKLYFFYNHDKNNTLLLWNTETTRLKEEAYKNWPTVKNQ